MAVEKVDFLDSFEQHILLFAKEQNLKETTREEYRSFCYPKLIKLMKFTTHQFQIDGFGSIMLMRTNAMGGLMKLLTISFTPSSGCEVPFLLIDAMSMKKKKACFVEYYDCTRKKLSYSELMAIKEQYREVSDYDEKPAWYVGERMEESLIKGGKVANIEEAQALEQELLKLALESFDAYMKLISSAPLEKENLKGLRAFKSRMQNEGNPSDSTMRKVLGEEGARKFFDEYVMPIN